MRYSPATEQAPSPLPVAAGYAVRVTGLVQGVGFRPAIWRLARDCDLAGDVCNDASGVLIRIWGETPARQRFLDRLRRETPPLSRIDTLEYTPLDDPAPGSAFRIGDSHAGSGHTGVVPDAATCGECRRELFDARDRRHGYAFGSCTHCGPRLSIVRRIPWDRANTSMAAFALCAACRREYQSPDDRRFHAQPIACPDCGPRLWLAPVAAPGIDVDGGARPIAAALRLLRAGRIVAIKGTGGIHLACDATNAQAVERLRRRKGRLHKPFALMAGDCATIRRYCRLGAEEAALLESAAAPIVLLEADGRERLAGAVAPGQHAYGFMLPYSPLHHLLLAGLDAPIVLTSGNRSGDPQCTDNDQARTLLTDIADAFLLNDRDIVNRMDDSVVRIIAGQPALLRRARGFAPASLRLPAGFAAAPAVLAMGGEQKNTFCLLQDGEAVLSPHLGDLENAAAHAAYREALERYRALFELQPRVFAIDAHPDYLPSRLGLQLAGNTPVETVQHHHAHVASCLADNGLDLDEPPVLGIALDGSGYGDDGTLWGGEFLVADYRRYRRIAAFAPSRMPGGAQATRQPWRMGWAHLRQYGNWPGFEARYAAHAFFRGLADKPLATLESMLKSGCNSPETSSCGRLFDAVAAVVGLCQVASYEGQAAVELEAAVDPAALHDIRAYRFDIVNDAGLPRLSPRPMWQALLADLDAGVARGVMAARFHAGLARAIVRMVDHLVRRHDNAWSGRIALSGGVFQNACLSELLIEMLEVRGNKVLRHRFVPANDGGLSLGQATVAAARAVDRHRIRSGGPAICA